VFAYAAFNRDANALPRHDVLRSVDNSIFESARPLIAERGKFQTESWEGGGYL
jgi:hypothetical protein